MTTTAPTDAIAPRLRPAQVGLRKDLDVHRHVFRGEVSYVIRDPITLAVHKLSEADYQLCAALSEDRSLGDVFDEFVANGTLDQDDEESFFQFILSLHGLGFLNLPVPNNEALYRRRQQKIKARRAQKVTGFLFMQVPLINPDSFLDRTKHLVSWVFTKWTLMVWSLVVGSALLLLLKNWGTFFTPIGDIFTPERLLGMWIALVSLKVIHEFGHAYACKVLGGEVPEIGAYFIAGTPCAYCDCTSSWGFNKRFERLIVVLAGVYVELFIAALAVFVWAIAPSASVQLIAFDIVVVAGVATILANLNPLMRFDGYYILSDILEIPNLRSTAQRLAISLIKRIFIGVPMPATRFSPGMTAGLIVFGVLSALYKITIVMGISALLATKFLYLGIGLAVFYGGMEFYRVGKNVGNYLIHSEEAQIHRVRAGALATLLFAAAPAFLVFVPVPRPVMALGTVGMEQEASYYATGDGFIESINAQPGDILTTGEPIAILSNPTLEHNLKSAEYELKRATILSEALLAEDPSAAAIHRESAEAAKARLQREQERLSELSIDTESACTVLEVLPRRDEGKFSLTGDRIAHVGSGRWVIRGLVREAALSHAPIHVGDQIAFRSTSAQGQSIHARVTRLEPLGSRVIRHETLTALAGGEIPIAPETGEANEPYFELEAVIVGDADIAYGITGNILIGSYSEPIAISLWRSGLRLLQKLEQN
jgi:putative peptide zinc metalloprotease protein